ncbi:MAG TPA: metallophosphoesterase family protein [Thermodesulfovibrionales bacterium]|jgi:predicted phosphodiesterase|nr:metallophosphoesterase family protein [Thermodesulfovibrionales bacterium]
MMVCAVVSDVHANLEALEAVLEDIGKRSIDDIYFLGDAVGYGPDPNECVEILKKHCKILLAGNHDRAAIGMTDIEYFNEYAKKAILWTREALTERTRKTLEALPEKKDMKKENILLVHSTPKEPEMWHYLLTLWDAEINFHYFDRRICMLGHSHQPFIIERLSSGEMVTYRNDAAIGKAERYIINAGSVGQPRDRDPRACYALINDDRVSFVRVRYDIEKTQGKMHGAGLPLPLIERLAQGT